MINYSKIDEEIVAGERLNYLILTAIKNKDRNLIRKIRRLWDNESFSRIKEKWLSEGSGWYVWQMYGIQQFIQSNLNLPKSIINDQTVVKALQNSSWERMQNDK